MEESAHAASTRSLTWTVCGTDCKIGKTTAAQLQLGLLLSSWMGSFQLVFRSSFRLNCIAGCFQLVDLFAVAFYTRCLSLLSPLPSYLDWIWAFFWKRTNFCSHPPQGRGPNYSHGNWTSSQDPPIVSGRQTRSHDEARRIRIYSAWKANDCSNNYDLVRWIATSTSRSRTLSWMFN